MKLYPHLIFGGHCETAFRFYEECLGGSIVTMLTYGESPLAEQTAPEWRDKILHATLQTGDGVLMGVDVFPGQYEPPKGFHVLLSVEDIEEAERVFNALAENGRVEMPLQKTFWAARFGMLLDQFGISWEINCAENPQPGRSNRS